MALPELKAFAVLTADCVSCGVVIPITPRDADKQPDGTWKARWEVKYCLQCALFGPPYEEFKAKGRRSAHSSDEDDEFELLAQEQDAELR